MPKKFLNDDTLLHASFTSSHVNVAQRNDQEDAKSRVKKSRYRPDEYESVMEETLSRIKNNMDNLVIIQTGATIQIYNKSQIIKTYDDLTKRLQELHIRNQ